MGSVSLPRLSARLHLVLLIAAALVPVLLFSAYLLAQYAMSERKQYERDALQVARQVSLVVEAELQNLLTVLRGLATSNALAAGDLETLHREASRLVHGTDRIVVLRDMGRRQLLTTQSSYATDLPPAAPLSAVEAESLAAGRPVVGEVYRSPASGEHRVAVALPVRGPDGEDWVLALSVPTTAIRDALLPAVPRGWIVGVGDRDGTYVARSEMHEAVTGQPGLPEYLEKAQGRAGTFTSTNFEQNRTLLAGYYRPHFSDWLYGANIPLSVVQAPLWRSLAAIGAMGLVTVLISAGLAYAVGKGFAKAASDLANRAEALGHGRPVLPLDTSVAEFAEIGAALSAAERAIAERSSELDTVLATVPAAVWFTYDPQARKVIRNRFAAELMGLPTETRTTWGTTDLVIDTIAFKDGHPVGREDRPLSRAMRGEQTDHEEFTYVLPSGGERHLLSSARSIYDKTGAVVGAVQVSLDISERKHAEEQRKLLVSELNHRVKNTLAVVQSIAAQTLRNAPDLKTAQAALVSRLVSLGKAHDVLTQESWSGAHLDDLIRGTIEPHAGLERFELKGERVWLHSNLALSLALAMHELATNAIKYGALAREGGSVSIAWRVAGGRLRIEWRETGGPPVGPARRKGFGTRMIARSLDAHSGKVTLEFERNGLVCILEAKLDRPDRKPAPELDLAGS